MFFDRNPLWTLFSDKWRVRQYVAERVGTDCLIPLLWHGTDPEDIPFDLLPSRFVIKATHGCQYNIIVQDKGQLNRAETIAQLRKWLKVNYGTDVYLGAQWGYKNVKPSIIIEEFIGSNGLIPWDYKILCFSGRVHFIKVHIDRYGHQSTIVMDRDFHPVDLQIGPLPPHADLERPKNHQELVRVAEVLAEGLDFIRVDLYAVEGRIYFGELTCYPGGGCSRFPKREDDFALSERWLISTKM